MKCVILFGFVLTFAVVAWSQPIDIEEELKQTDLQPSEHIRVRRFTCDVLSAEAKGVKINHAACGAHCLLRGRTGGYCNSKRVCICR